MSSIFDNQINPSSFSFFTDRCVEGYFDSVLRCISLIFPAPSTDIERSTFRCSLVIRVSLTFAISIFFDINGQEWLYCISRKNKMPQAGIVGVSSW